MNEKTIEPPDHPEAEKLSARASDRDAILEFLQWARHEKGLRLGHAHQHTDDCYEEHSCIRDDHTCIMFGACNKETERVCEIQQGQMLTPHTLPKDLVLEFLDIDQHKLDQERRAMLANLRERSRQEA